MAKEKENEKGRTNSQQEIVDRGRAGVEKLKEYIEQSKNKSISSGPSF